MQTNPCNIYDHQVIKLRTKITDRPLLPQDVRTREIVFDDITNQLYVKKNSQEYLVRYGELSDTMITENNNWSQKKTKREAIKMQLVLG